MVERYGKDDILLSAREAAEYLGVCYQTLAIWRHQKNDLKWVRSGSWRVKYYMSDIREFLENCGNLRRRKKDK